MSDRAQRVLDALIEYKDRFAFYYPVALISAFCDFVNSDYCSKELSDDYEALIADEEEQVIKEFLEY